jgi:caffeoyl-CoA O-methyltransferase
MDLTAYVESLYGGEDELLRAIREEAAAEEIPAINIPHSAGQLLGVLVAASRARRVLEIGTLFGYSAILMGRALPDDGKMICLEVSSKHADVSRRNIERAGLSGKVEVRQGAAADLLSGMTGEQFDLVFIDADKPGYPVYLEKSLELAHPGTVIIADNTWRHGDVTSGSDPTGDAMARFNRLVADNPRLLTAMVPRTDGGDALSVSVVKG